MKNTEYYISRDKSKLNIEVIKSLLKQCYWADKRTEGTILKSIENSICYGVYRDDNMVGFGRVVTDYSTVYWVCDIIIDYKYRGNGLGKKLMENITSTKELEGLMGILATRDAHGLYEQYGFEKDPDRFMRKKRTRN